MKTLIIGKLVQIIEDHDGINDKAKLSDIIEQAFRLNKDRSVFYSNDFAIRFCKGLSPGFSNTVLSLSNLKKYDDRPFFVCLVTPAKNYLFLANSTFLQKISHSSQQLRVDNIKGSFNGSDIMKQFHGLQNTSENFELLFSIHEETEFRDNLIRLVESTNKISPSGEKFMITSLKEKIIMQAPIRARLFLESAEYLDFKNSLDSNVKKYQKEILIASKIENVNLRGRLIEYLVASEDEETKSQLIFALTNDKPLPKLITLNKVGDYSRKYRDYNAAADIKTKMLYLSSNPKAYNIDKMLQFLSEEKSVFLLYFIGIGINNTIKTALISMFQPELLSDMTVITHWAGRNSRGVTQFIGDTIKDIIVNGKSGVDVLGACDFLKKMIAL